MHYWGMKRCLLILAFTLASSAATEGVAFELLTSRSMTLSTDQGDLQIPFAYSRTLVIHAASGATAYQIAVITRDGNGGRRTWTWTTPRNEQVYGDPLRRRSATFFTLPIDIDVPLLDIWVTALVISGDAGHLKLGE